MKALVTGASNGMKHCDVSFLYDYSVFGDELDDKVDIDETIAGTVEIDLSNYPNLPVNAAINYADMANTFSATGSSNELKAYFSPFA